MPVTPADCESSTKTKICHLCKPPREMLNKNYKKHLKDKHPGQESLGLRPQGQMGLKDFLKKRPKEAHVEVKQEALSDDDEDMFLNENNVLERSVEGNDAESHVEVNGNNKTLVNEEEVLVEEEEMETIETRGSEEAMTDLKIKVGNLEKLVNGIKLNVSDIEMARQSAENSNAIGDRGDVKTTGGEVKDDDVKPILRGCRCVEDILEAFPIGFNERKGLLFCLICVSEDNIKTCDPNVFKGGIFAYDKYEEDKDAQILSREFRNAKTNVGAHLIRESHKKAVNEDMERKKMETNSSTDRSVGLKIGRTCYDIFKRGGSFSDYPRLILLQDLNGCKIGTLNHSTWFIAKFLPHVAAEVKSRKIHFLTTRLKQTGYPPPGALTGDLATFLSSCRHFGAVIVVVPGAPHLLQVKLNIAQYIHFQ